MKKLLIAVGASLAICAGAHAAADNWPSVGAAVYVASPLWETVEPGKFADKNLPTTRLDCLSYTRTCFYKIPACERLKIQSIARGRMTVKDDFGMEATLAYPIGLPPHHPFPSIHPDGLSCDTANTPKH